MNETFTKLILILIVTTAIHNKLWETLVAATCICPYLYICMYLYSQTKMNCIVTRLFVPLLVAAATFMSTRVRGFEDGSYIDIYSSISSFNESVPLYIGLMLSLSGDQQSIGALVGVQAALDDINSRDDLLPGYSLHYTLTDSKVHIIMTVTNVCIPISHNA